jgi:hypothetical protein
VPVIPAFGKVTMEDLEFKTSLGCMVRLSQKKKINKRERITAS